MDRAELLKRLGLDKPIIVQYGVWMEHILLHGDFGNGLYSEKPVIDGISPRIPVSAELGVLAIIIGLIIAIPIGVYSAIRQDTVGDYIGRSFAIACIALPGFWLGTLVMTYPSVWWDWSPPMTWVSFFDNPLGNLGIVAIPAFILGMGMSGITMRMTRTMMLEVLRQDYVRTAWAKGLRERVVIFRHVIKNALIPVVTLVGLQLPVLIGGAVVIEQIFNLPGVGRLMLQSITLRDYPTIAAINVIIAVAVLVINLVVDMSYAYFDPRIRYR
jgi:peptide/nickel transport system permease protein